jgi:hypothetical protein
MCCQNSKQKGHGEFEFIIDKHVTRAKYSQSGLEPGEGLKIRKMKEPL